jgi:hypothetical protein
MDNVNFISIIDYIGGINNGVALLLSMKVNDNIYEIGYWFDRNDNYLLSADENFLKDFNIKSIYEYKNHKKLSYYIHNFVLQNKEELLNDFLENHE